MTSVASSTLTSERSSRPCTLPAPDRVADGLQPISDSPPPQAASHNAERPDAAAGLRLGLRTRQGWTPQGEALLERIAEQSATLEVRSLSEVARHVSARAADLGLTWVRVEHSPGLSLEELPRSVSAAALATGALEFGTLACVGADRFGRRVMLASARSQSAGWFLDLAPAPSALLEHLLESGRWPLWLAEEQVWVLPLRAAQVPAAAALVERLQASGYRASAQEPGPLGNLIHHAARERVPALCVLGPREVRDERVALRWRGQDQHEVLTEEALFAALAQAAHPHPAEVTSAKSLSATDKTRFVAPNRRH